MSRHHYSGDALIEVLHTAQELYGFLTPDLLKDHSPETTAAAKPSAWCVATFYHFFFTGA